MSSTVINMESIGDQLKSAVEKADLAAVQAICESKGVDINATLIKYSTGNCTVLWYAVYRNKVDIARYLLTLQADVTVLHTTWRRSPLHWAVFNNNSELVALLLERGAERYLQDSNGNSPLADAARDRNREVGELLVSGPVKALLVATEEGAKLTATKELLQLYETTAAEHRAVVTTFIAETEMEELFKILLNNSHPDTTKVELRDASFRLGKLLMSHGRGPAGPVNALLDATEEEATLTATKELLQLYETTKAEYRAVMTTFIAEMGRIMQILLDNSHPDTSKIELRNTSLLLLSLITECFTKIADDPKHSVFLFKGNIFIKLVELASGDHSTTGLNITTILKSTYVVLQAKIQCDESRQKFLKDLIEDDVFTKFSTKIKMYAEQESDNDLQCIAYRIYKEYIAEKKTETKFNCTSPDNHSSDNQDQEKVKEKTVKEGKDTHKKEGNAIHRCNARGYFTLLSCIFGLYFYTNDIMTDFAVGLEDYHIFSTRLGFFELFLVVFTLLHENLNSAVVLYETESELLKLKLGQPDISSQDWIKKSQLNYSENATVAFLYKFFWPFKVNGRCCGSCGTIKAVLFNFLSLIMLRPVVDRLVVLLHEPSSLRTYYRQQAQQNALKQFYLILEQIPELLVQFYTFQIILNKLPISPGEECKLDFYTDYNDKFNTTEPNFFCGKILHYTESGLVSCGVVFRIYSMLLPFGTIPFGIVSLEDSFRILDPTTPKMPSLTKNLLKLVYMLMIPSRLFMFAAAMHALPNHFWVIGYLICRILLELLVNLTLHKCYVKVIKPSESWRHLFAYAIRRNADDEDEQRDILSCRAELLSKLRIVWSLCLFSMRDVFLISLRKPYAYTHKPSDVNGKSLRSWKTLALKSLPYFVEGIAGAILIQLNYPCGKQSHIFKYLGWFCFVLLVLSVTLYCLLIGITDAKKGGAKKIKERGPEKDDITCDITCEITCSPCCISCLCCICRRCCRGRDLEASVNTSREETTLL